MLPTASLPAAGLPRHPPPTGALAHLEPVAALVLDDEPQVILRLVLRHLGPRVPAQLPRLGLACARGAAAAGRRREGGCLWHGVAGGAAR